MTIKCENCHWNRWRTETKETKLGRYCACDGQSQRSDEEYAECKRFLAAYEAKQWKAR